MAHGPVKVRFLPPKISFYMLYNIAAMCYCTKTSNKKFSVSDPLKWRVVKLNSKLSNSYLIFVFSPCPSVEAYITCTSIAFSFYLAVLNSTSFRRAVTIIILCRHYLCSGRNTNEFSLVLLFSLFFSLGRLTARFRHRSFNIVFVY